MTAKVRRERARTRDAGGGSVVAFLLTLVVVGGVTANIALKVHTSGRLIELQAANELHLAAVRAADELTTQIMVGTAPGLADAEQLEQLQSGLADAAVLAGRPALDERISMRAASTLAPMPGLAPRAASTVSIAHFDLVSPLLGNVVNAEGLGLLDDVAGLQPGLATTVHDWQFRWNTLPATGLGSVFADHAWHVEHDLVPRLAGIQATYVNVDNLGTPNGAAEQAAFDRYVEGSTPAGRTVAAWRVVREGLPGALPGEGAAQDHVLAVGFPHPNAAQDANGLGLWRTHAGHRAWAVIGPLNATGLEDSTLTFRHYLRFTQEANVVDRARILFWNWSLGTWQDLDDEPGCAQGGNVGWEGAGGAADDTDAASWETRTVDLCEPAETGGDVWLAFYWDTACTLFGVERACAERPAGMDAAWFLDDLRVSGTRDGREVVLYETDMTPRPRAAANLLVVGDGVTHGLDLAAPTPGLVSEPIERFVDNGGGVIALRPGTVGEWLSGIGLEARPADPQQPENADARQPVWSVPNELPATSDLYKPSSFVWALDASGPQGAPARALTAVQRISGGVGTALVLAGRPGDAGAVIGVAYDLSSWDADPDQEALRQDLVTNVLTHALLPPVTFDEIADQDVHEAAATVKRLMVAELAEGRAVVAIHVALRDVALEE